MMMTMTTMMFWYCCIVGIIFVVMNIVSGGSRIRNVSEGVPYINPTVSPHFFSSSICFLMALTDEIIKRPWLQTSREKIQRFLSYIHLPYHYLIGILQSYIRPSMPTTNFAPIQTFYKLRELSCDVDLSKV